MIDWTKEISTKNYCGYCTKTPTGSSCDSSCFKDNKENRVDHIIEMLKKIPLQIEELKNKEKDYKEALSA
jgi:hypothetical protein